MKAFYYLSYVLSAPFYVVAWTLFGVSWFFNSIGDMVHNSTTCKAWLVLHRRKVRVIHEAEDQNKEPQPGETL